MEAVKEVDEAPERALSRRMDDYGDFMVRLAYGLLKDAYLAQDAAQDAFFKAYRSHQSFQGKCSEKCRLTKILMNVCRDYLRTAWMKRVNRKISLDQLPDLFTEASMPDKTVPDAVLSLPVRLRQAVLLRYWQNMQIKEIGEALGISPEAVKSRLERANLKLHQALKEWHDDE